MAKRAAKGPPSRCAGLRCPTIEMHAADGAHFAFLLAYRGRRWLPEPGERRMTAAAAAVAARRRASSGRGQGAAPTARALGAPRLGSTGSETSYSRRTDPEPEREQVTAGAPR
jgi:hypothetical protein